LNRKVVENELFLVGGMKSQRDNQKGEGGKGCGDFKIKKEILLISLLIQRNGENTEYYEGTRNTQGKLSAAWKIGT